MNDLFFTVQEFCTTHRIGLTQFYKEVNAGRLALRKLGRKSLVSADAAKAWRDSLPVLHKAA